MDMVDNAPGRFRPDNKPSKEEQRRAERRLELLQRQKRAAKERLFTSEAELAIAKESSDLSQESILSLI